MNVSGRLLTRPKTCAQSFEWNGWQWSPNGILFDWLQLTFSLEIAVSGIVAFHFRKKRWNKKLSTHDSCVLNRKKKKNSFWLSLLPLLPIPSCGSVWLCLTAAILDLVCFSPSSFLVAASSSHQWKYRKPFCSEPYLLLSIDHVQPFCVKWFLKPLV